jgi:hypothetical protein
MTGLLGALPASPAASTIEFEDDVDDGPPGERCQRVRQRPPPSLKTTSMMGALGGAGGGSNYVHHRVLKTAGLDPILCPNILQNRAWKAVIIHVGLIPQAANLRYA